MPAAGKGRGARLRLALIAISLTSGCGDHVQNTWSFRTRAENRYYLHDGRGDRRIAYRDLGPPDARFTLMFLHGLGTAKFIWKDFAPPFSGTHRVVLVDLLGHGDSDKPLGYDYSMLSQARIVEDFIGDLGIRDVILIGQSYGAVVALECARRETTRQLNGSIRGVIAMSPPASFFELLPKDQADVDRLKRERTCLDCVPYIPPQLIGRALLKRALFHHEHLPQELIDEWAYHYQDRVAQRSALLATIALREQLETLKEAGDRFSSVRIPVFVVAGDHDMIVPRSVFERLASSLPNGTLAVIADAGHAIAIDQPEVLRDRVGDFLTKVESGGGNP